MISIIVAASRNNVIGAHGALPWHLPDDLKRFKAVTMGKPIIMGRKTWDSIGRPLSGRQNIVISRQDGFSAEGCDVAASVEEAVEAAGDVDEIMVIGGSQIYELALPLAQRLYLTRVHAVVEGDAFFLPVNTSEWQLVSDETFAADERNEFGCSFRIYERPRSAA